MTVIEQIEARTANRRLAKKRVHCLNEVLCFVSSLCSETRPNAKPENVIGHFKDANLTRIATILIGLTFLTSCDCLRQVSGTVLDKTTARPVGFAEVQILGSNNSPTTDSLGNFQLRIINSGLQCYCKPKKKITISSPLYLSDTFELNKTPYKLQADTNYIKKFFDPKNDFMRKWAYFNLVDTIELKVIHHILATMDCGGGIETFSITIGTMQSGDTIRVLELCNRINDFNLGDMVSVIPGVKPEENYKHPGVFVQGYQGQLRPSHYDNKILKTTYGILKNK